MQRLFIRKSLRSCAALALAACLVPSCAASAAGVHCALTPALVEVDPAEEFTIEFTITEADASFNGFDAVVEFDPAMLTFLPTAPSALQQGAAMTEACGNTFHLFSAAADSLVFTSVLLCAGQSLTGPGVVYTLRFRAGAATGMTPIRLRAPRVRFYNAGLYVFPVETADALVRIGQVTGVAPAIAPGLSLRARPNPARSGTTVLHMSVDRAGPQRVSIHDVRGRVLRLFEWPTMGAGEHVVAWDGLDQQGRRVAAGGYVAVLRAGGRQVESRFIVVH